MSAHRDGELVTEIHIFLLANVLRRPILMYSLSEKSTFDQTDISGIYLPLLSDAKLCVIHPLVLARLENRFYPIVRQNESSEPGSIDSIRAVPIVTHEIEPIPIRCLTELESKRVSKLLQDYLKLDEVHLTGPNAVQMILCARMPACEITESDCDVWSELTAGKDDIDKLESTIRTLTAWKSCSTLECPAEGLELFNGKCRRCYILQGNDVPSPRSPIKTSMSVSLIKIVWKARKGHSMIALAFYHQWKKVK